jgi:hypothetical protein
LRHAAALAVHFPDVTVPRITLDRLQGDEMMNATLPLPEQETPAFPSVEAYLVDCEVTAEAQDDWWLDLGQVNIPGVLAV